MTQQRSRLNRGCNRSEMAELRHAAIGALLASDSDREGGRQEACRLPLGPNQRSGEPRTSKGRRCSTVGVFGYVERPVFTAAVQTFRDHRTPSQARQLVEKLARIPVAKEIIINDDAWGEGADVWQRWLLEFAPRADECEIARTNAFYIGSPNLHEIRVYNRLAALSRGEFFMLVQGDYCLPDARAGGGLWMLHALRAFRALPRLAMLSGRVGYDDVLTRETPEAERRAKSWGQAPERPLRFEIPSGRAVREAGDWARLSGGLSTPVQFVPAVDNGPLLFRRSALIAAGGFDESYSCAGEVGMHYDWELSLRFWRAGHEVAVYYGGGTNGLGGRKTTRSPALRTQRHRSELMNAVTVRALWAEHNRTVLARIAAATAQLAPIADGRERDARLQAEARIGRLSKPGCYRGEAYSETLAFPLKTS